MLKLGKHILYSIGLIILLTVFENTCNAQFFNGDFNLGFGNCVGPVGWRTNNTQVSDLFQSGNNWVDITGCTYGNGYWIEQDIQVSPGKIYFIRMDLGTWSEWDDEDAGVDIFINGVQLGERLFNDEFSQTPGWRLFWKRDVISCFFIPNSHQVTVRITGHSKCTSTSPPAKCASPAPGVIAIDNVELDSIDVVLPETNCLYRGGHLTYTIKGKSMTHTTEWWYNNQLYSRDSVCSVSQPGNYTLKLNIPCVEFKKTVLVDTIKTERRTYQICQGDSVYVNGVFVMQEGQFYDTIHYANKCSKIIASVVKLKSRYVHSPANTNRYLCTKSQDTLVLDPGQGFMSYRWQPSGTDSSALKVWKPGKIYVVLLKDSNHCADTIVYNLIEVCNPDCYIPDAFTPNGDGSNDIFPPLLSFVHSFSLKIFNRWGEQLYETNDPKMGWDGQYLGEPCQESVYIYILSFKSQIDNKSYLFEGTITLLR